MRHGRKTKRVTVDGYKRHVLTDLDTELVPAVGVTAANLPEASGRRPDHRRPGRPARTLGELHIDRAYLSSSLVRDRDPDLRSSARRSRSATVPASPSPRSARLRPGPADLPQPVTMPFVPGGKVQFPAQVCAACPLRTQCTTSTRGRSVQIHPDERLLVELRAAQQTPRAGPGCASGPPSSTPWPMSAAGRAAVPATWASARTCSTCAGSRSSTTSTSSPANPHQPTSRLINYLADALESHQQHDSGL